MLIIMAPTLGVSDLGAGYKAGYGLARLSVLGIKRQVSVSIPLLRLSLFKA